MAQLAALAQDMRRQLEQVEKGAVTRTLFGGLVIVYERRGRDWRLAIGRIGAPPSKTEAEVVGAAFVVPPGVEWTWTERRTKKRLTYRVAECVWIETEGGDDATTSELE